MSEPEMRPPPFFPEPNGFFTGGRTGGGGAGAGVGVGGFSRSSSTDEGDGDLTASVDAAGASRYWDVALASADVALLLQDTSMPELCCCKLSLHPGRRESPFSHGQQSTVAMNALKRF